MKRILLSLMLLCTVPSAAQQPSAPAADTASVASLAREVETLKRSTSAWGKIVERLPRISGYVQLGYQWAEGSSSFQVKRVRLMLDGDIAPRLDYRVQVELAAPRIVDAYVRYRPFDALNLQLGEYKLPFGIENTEYVPLKFELIDYPLALQRLMGFSEKIFDQTLKATGRDMGLQLYGSLWKREGYSVLTYNAGLFNGEGINAADRNKSKDLAVRLMLRPALGLTLSGSYYRGEFGPEYVRRDRYAAGAAYDRGAVSLRAEWIGGRTADLDSDGWYALCAWRVTPRWMPAVRYEVFREDTSRRESRQANYTAGILYQPYRLLRCQLNYSYEDYRSRAVENRNVVQVLLSGSF